MKHIILSLILLSSFNVFSQTGQYVKDIKTGCMIWSDEYSPKDSLIWSGSCKNGYAFGNGILRWYQDHKLAVIYTGQMNQGKLNGKGKYEIIGYATFEGNFTNGALNGKGAAHYSNGGKTIGNFVDGNFLNLDDKYLAILRKQYLNINDSTEIYINDNGSDQLFYYALIPRQTINAVLVLFPSTGETAENVISCNKNLMQQAYNNNILPVVVSVNYNKTLESDQKAMQLFDTVFEDLIRKYRVPKDKFILSGLSLGGMNALQYTEMSRNKKYITFIKPLAVIGIDPPIDMADLYNGAKKSIIKYEKEGADLSESKKIALNEDRFIIDNFTKLYGGSPEEFPDKYTEASQFSRNREDGGNAKYLIDVPVRVYCDPDIVWQLKNKSRDYYDLNAANLSAMTNFLMQSGNTRAEFIPAIGKGFRVDGKRHPHSWSIVEPIDCIKWILNLAK